MFYLETSFQFFLFILMVYLPCLIVDVPMDIANLKVTVDGPMLVAIAAIAVALLMVAFRRKGKKVEKVSFPPLCLRPWSPCGCLSPHI